MSALALALAAVAEARGWSRPTPVITPAALEIAGTHLAFSDSGQAAVGFAFVDPDHPAGSQAWAALISARGRPSPARHIPRARQVLDVAFASGAFRVLVGADGGARCCATARELALGARGLGAQRTLARGLGGVVLGRLVAVGRGMLVALADAVSLRLTQARSGTSFGPLHRLTPRGVAPRSLMAEPLLGSRTMLAWLDGTFAPQDTPTPEAVMVAAGTASHVPGPPQTAVTLAAGHQAGQLALAAGPRPTVAWIEDFTDTAGAYHSEVSVLTAGAGRVPVTFTTDGMVASGPSAAGDSRGDQILAWSSCDATATCQVMAATRTPRGSFGSPLTLGSIDAGTHPAVALTSSGTAFVGWTSAGHVIIARGSPTAGFGARQRLSGPGYADELTLAAGPGGRLLAAWADGSPRETLEVSMYSAR